jgi:hypothetical protein
MLFLINFLLFIKFFGNDISKKKIFQNAIIFMFLYLFINEAMSFFNMFNIFFLRCLNISVLFILVFSYNRKIYYDLRVSQFSRLTIEKFFFILLFVSGIIYFPSNYDSNSYHLPRFISWLQNENLNHYPTSIYRQIYQPYLNEVFLANIYSTYGPLSLLNLWSVFLLGLTFLSLKQIIENLPLNFRVGNKNIIYIFLLCFSLISSAVTTKNDIQALFLLCVLIISIQEFIFGAKKHLVLAFYAVILGYLTKGTFQIHSFSIVVIILIILWWNKVINKKFLQSIFLEIKRNSFLIALGIIILFPTFKRNLLLTNNLSGQSKRELGAYLNKEINIESGVSNTIKNVIMHSSLPIFGSPFNEKELEKFGKALKLPSIHDLGLNFVGSRFQLNSERIKGFFNSDTVPNYLIFYLSLLVLVLGLLFSDKYVYFRFLFILLLALIQLFVFSFLLRWQPWHTRLLFPVFLTISFGIIFALENTPFFRFLKFFVVLNATIVICFNAQQPIISYSKLTRGFPNIWSDAFFKGDLFQRQPDWHEQEFHYKEFQEKIGYSKNVGLLCDECDKIFGYMADNRNTKCSYHYLNINNNPTGKLIRQVKQLDYIILNKSSSFWLKNRTKYLLNFNYNSDTMSSWLLLKSKV